MLYVLVVVVSPAVTMIAIVFVPTLSACDGEVVLDERAPPATVSEAALSDSVGVNVIDVTLFATVTP
jgi:hypothetical protein